MQRALIPTKTLGSTAGRATGSGSLAGWCDARTLLVGGNLAARSCPLTAWTIAREGPASAAPPIVLDAPNPRIVRLVDAEHVVVVGGDGRRLERWALARPDEPQWSVELPGEIGAIAVHRGHVLAVTEPARGAAMAFAVALEDGAVETIATGAEPLLALAVDEPRGRIAIATREGPVLLDDVAASPRRVETGVRAEALAFTASGSLVVVPCEGSSLHIVGVDGTPSSSVALPSRSTAVVAHGSRARVLCIHRDRGPTLVDLDACTITSVCDELVHAATFTPEGLGLVLVTQHHPRVYGIRSVPLDDLPSREVVMSSIVSLVPLDDDHVLACDLRQLVCGDLRRGALQRLPDPPPLGELWGLARAGGRIFAHGLRGLWSRAEGTGWTPEPCPHEPDSAAPPSIERIALAADGTTALVGVSAESRGFMRVERWSRASAEAPWTIDGEGDREDADELVAQESAVAIARDGSITVQPTGEHVMIDDGEHRRLVPGTDLCGAVVLGPTIALGLDDELVVVDLASGATQRAAGPLRWLCAVDDAHVLGYVAQAKRRELRVQRLRDLAVVASLDVTSLPELTCGHATPTQVVVGTTFGTIHALTLELAADSPATPAPALPEGALVRVIKGAYRGMTGRIVGERDDRLEVELEVFGLPTKVSMARNELAPA